MTDERLQELLRSAMPASTGESPARDRWPRMANRFERAPRWSYLDLSLAAAVLAALAIFPEWLWPLAYHL